MKRLIICCDGTWNSPENAEVAPSNVIRFANAVLPADSKGVQQVVYYDAGVGTGGIIDKFTGGAFGSGLSVNVRQAYRFIVNNYEDGDALYFFGFSRGAYTVRSAAGFVRTIGIVHKENSGRILEGWDLYVKREGGPDRDEVVKFREKHSRPEPEKIDVRCVGVWDTVGTLGVPGVLGSLHPPGWLKPILPKAHEFHDVALSSRVKFGFQAVAVDEKRKFFRPTLWEQSPKATEQVLEQVWFPGVHADVGGGYKERALADNTFVWMVESAKRAGLEFDDGYIRDNFHPDSHGKKHESLNFVYARFGRFDRPIGQSVDAPAYTPPGATRQSLSEATRRRYIEDTSYRPPKLVEYMDSPPPADS
jgi:uncharacterized protein (DUF2235 family)